MNELTAGTAAFPNLPPPTRPDERGADLTVVIGAEVQLAEDEAAS
jgi:hypothetical protein